MIEITNKEIAARQRLLQLQDEFPASATFWLVKDSCRLRGEIKSAENLIKSLERQGLEANRTADEISKLKAEIDTLAESDRLALAECEFSKVLWLNLRLMPINSVMHLKTFPPSLKT